MPTTRRVIFGTHVIPTQSVEGEETAIRHTEFQASPNGTLGGKGIATINATQWGDEWTSMEHADLSQWEDFTTVNWEDFTSNWEAGGSGQVTITTTAAKGQLSDAADVLAFLYIKNTGNSSRDCLVSLNGSSGNFYIIVPPNGSMHLKGDGTNLNCDEVYVKSSGATTTIEYIIAKV